MRLLSAEMLIIECFDQLKRFKALKLVVFVILCFLFDAAVDRYLAAVIMISTLKPGVAKCAEPAARPGSLP